MDSVPGPGTRGVHSLGIHGDRILQNISRGVMTFSKKGDKGPHPSSGVNTFVASGCQGRQNKGDKTSKDFLSKT